MCTAEKQRAQIVRQCYTNINSGSRQDQEVVLDPQVSPEEIKSREVILWWSLCTLYLHTCARWVTIGNSGLCRCIWVTFFKRWLTPLGVDSARVLWASFCFRTFSLSISNPFEPFVILWYHHWWFASEKFHPCVCVCVCFRFDQDGAQWVNKEGNV